MFQSISFLGPSKKPSRETWTKRITFLIAGSPGAAATGALPPIMPGADPPRLGRCNPWRAAAGHRGGGSERAWLGVGLPGARAFSRSLTVLKSSTTVVLIRDSPQD